MDEMKSAVAALFVLPLALWGQSESRTYVFDSEGRRVPWSSASSTNGTSSGSVINLNGRSAPLERVDERVISQQGGVKTVERLIQRFAADGAKLPPEREVIETADLGGGRQTVSTTFYRGDFNGRMALAERVVEQTTPAGESSSSVTTVVERPNLNGSMEMFERREARLTGSGDRSERDETSYVKDTNGRLVASARVVERISKQGSKTVTQLDEFESITSGDLTLAKQTVSTTEDSPSGQMTVSDVYGPAAPGRPATGQLQLRERQIIEKSLTSSGEVKTFSVQRPSPDGSGRLGRAVKIAETVCTGKCAAQKP